MQLSLPLPLSLFRPLLLWHLFYFRVVHEIHSPATKRNKEWQEKLPVVVLRAEDIMYSKANSEVSSQSAAPFDLTIANY